MITFTKLLERAENKKIAIHTANKEQAITLLKALDEKGYEWLYGVKLITKTRYEDFKKNTCYSFYDYYGNILDKKIMYGSLNFHQEHDYTIIKFKDIDFKEEI